MRPGNLSFQFICFWYWKEEIIVEGEKYQLFQFICFWYSNRLCSSNDYDVNCLSVHLFLIRVISLDFFLSMIIFQFICFWYKERLKKLREKMSSFQFICFWYVKRSTMYNILAELLSVHLFLIPRGVNVRRPQPITVLSVHLFLILD